MEEETKTINFRVPIDLYKKIEDMARKNERNISSQIRFILIQYFKLTEQSQ